MTETTGACKQDIICVLGMHRSGTSLLTRVLNLLGLDLGTDQVLTTEPVVNNPKGYWEHNEFTAISDAILKRYGGSWDEPPLLPPGWETDSAIDDLRHRARQLIQDQFAEVQLWGWKDPRSCLTLPFWQPLLPQMRYIICLRNPVDVARSLERRDNLTAEKSSSLWLTYVSSALNYSEGKPRLVIFYEDLMDDCLRELRRLAGFLGKPERAKQLEAQEAMQQFIEKGLQHYRTPIAKATPGSGVELTAMALYTSQRISGRFGREGINGQHGVDNEIYNALGALSQYSFQAAGRRNPQGAPLTEHEQSVKTLSTLLVEKEAIVQRLTAQLAEQARAQRLQAEYAEETIGVLSAQLLNTATELRNIRDTLGGRLLSRYAHIKHSRILPIYRQFRQRFVKPIQPESLLDNHERVATIDKDSGGG
ncbi:MAG: hypothetical protein QOH96_974 [Blastocatellia bacterium]|nr:hypothetical protein [Blastocatellia bacterium]